MGPIDVWNFRVNDPVLFADRQGHPVTGHIARKTRNKAFVVTAEGHEYQVQWQFLARDRTGRRKRVKLEADAFKAQFRPDDEVEFEFDGKDIRGVIARFGPQNARIVASGGQDYVIPYSNLRALNPDPGRRDGVRLDRIARKTERLIAKHGLQGWSFQYQDASRQSGVCDHYTRVIGLSRLYCLKAPAHLLRNTILHEIAHALVGPTHNHDRAWKEKARAIGCSGDRCHTVDFAPPKWIESCPRCGWRARRNVRTRRVCGACNSRVKYRTYTRRRWEGSSP